MNAGQDIDRMLDATAYDEEGDRIGSVETIYLDDDSDEPKFALVNTGLFGTSSSFVPLEGARMDGDDLRVAYTKGKVKDAPNLDPEGRLEPSQEEELFHYYGISSGAKSNGPRSGGDKTSGKAGHDTTGHDTTGHDTTGTDSNDAMTRSEEELKVGTHQRETGRARLRKHVVTEPVTKTVQVQREEVSLEREPITDGSVDDATDGATISEDEHEVILHDEEVVVSKQAVPKERVRLDKETHTDEETVTDEVAHEKIDLVDKDTNRSDR